jgi:hypothetical protein
MGFVDSFLIITHFPSKITELINYKIYKPASEYEINNFFLNKFA